MTRETKLLIDMWDILHRECHKVVTEENYDAIKKSIKALEQEPCEDCISRQAAKRALEDRYIELQKRHDDKKYETNYCLNTILELPSVNPQKPKTRYISIDDVMSVFDDFMCGEVDENGTETFLEMLKDKAESEV